MRDKIEVYDGIVNMVRKSGQGLTSLVCRLDSSFVQPLKELKDEGLIESYYVVGDDWYFPKGCFSPFKGGQDDIFILSYVRAFLEIEDLGLGLTRTRFLTDPKYADRKLEYDKWLDENRVELEKMKNWPYYHEQFPVEQNSTNQKSDVLSIEVLEFVKSRDWYKDNKTIKECITLCEEGLGNDKKGVEICDRILELCHLGGGVGYEDKIKEAETDKAEFISNPTKRITFINWAKTQTQSNPIKTLIK